MATDNLQIPDISASQNQKEVTANAAHNLLDRAGNKDVSKAITVSTSFTTTETRENNVIELTGTPGAARTIDMPDTNKRRLTVVNNTDSQITIRNSVGAGAGTPIIAAAGATIFHYNGTDFFDIIALSGGGSSPAPEEAFIFFPAEGHINPTAAGGSAVLATVATAANQPDVTSLDFNQTTAEHAQLRHIFEEIGHVGNISFQFLWSHAAAATFGLTMNAKAVAVSDDGALGVNFGTARKIVDAGGTTDDHYLTERTGFVQVLTPVDLDLVIFDLFRDPVDSGDTLNVDARLQGVIMHFWKNQPLDPDWASVSLLAGFDGEDAATDQDDESDNALVATYNANAAVDTAFSRFSRGSAVFDGIGDNVTFPDDVDFAMGTGDFTLECQARWSEDTQSGALIAHWDTSINQRSYLLERDQSAGTLRVLFSTNGTNFFTDIDEIWAPTVGIWHHIAMDFDGTTYRLYVDGGVLGISTTLRTLHNSTAVFSLGGRGDATVLFIGNLDEVRVTKGVARYAGAFIPPTAPFPRA